MEFDNKVPIYYQIEQLIEHQIIRGDLAPGARVPAVRQLALDLTVNVNTVQRALANLVQRGVLVSERGRGNFVTTEAATLTELKQSLIQDELATMVQRLQALGLTPGEMPAALATYIQSQTEEEAK